MADLDKSKIQAVAQYIDDVSKKYATGIVTEHSYRGILENLLKELLPGFNIINEPKRIECGAPDYIIAKGNGTTSIPVAFIEAKDIGDRDLDGNRQNKEQFNRYKKSLDHILFTDYLDFHLYENGEFVSSIRIAEIRDGKIVLDDTSLLKFVEMICHLAEVTPQTITSSKKLAQIMAAKAKLLKAVIQKALENDNDKKSSLAARLDVFKKYLIHNLTKQAFADIYAQTIVYGMFAARLHDKTPETFSRSEAAELIPETNPFLRQIFNEIAGFNIDKNIVWIVDDLVEMFRVADINKIMEKFGKSNGFNDPLMNFYESFLAAYDSELKTRCGVFYTPEPVVKFMVSAVDNILKDRWNMPMGLADTSKITVKNSDVLYTDKRTKNNKRIVERTVHKVQILDPATGTGTFLAETIFKIWDNLKGNHGAWQNYVEEHLLPRLNGFEFMMAPYTIAHLKLDMALAQTGYKPKNGKRLQVYLTNSLEECDPDTGTLWATWLAQEAAEANIVKRDTPVMVMIGNPPYNNKSKNKGHWISDLLKTYKQNLNEKKINLDDDFIKFIRLGQYYVDNNGEGVLAYITKNLYIDGITHRQMRKTLLESFDEIYILNLHGSQKKGETKENNDENVFDITLGVCINIFIKRNQNEVKKKTNSKVYYYDLYGKRQEKYAFLETSSIKNISWIEIAPKAPYYFFVPKDFSNLIEYEKGFGIDELIKVYNSGVKTDRDTLFYDFDKDVLEERIKLLLSKKDLDPLFIEKFRVKDSSSYKLTRKMKNVKFDKDKIIKGDYRVFDRIFLYYDESLISRPAHTVAKHLIDKNNISLVTCRQLSTFDFQHIFVSSLMSDLNSISLQSKEQSYVFPLYIYPTDGEEKLGETRKPNLDEKIWCKINKCTKQETTPEQVFDYIYGVLHTSSYREKYKEFLKIDFPRIPYPENKEEFERIVSIGNKLRKLHLMEEIPPQATSFDIEGDNAVTDIKYEKEIPGQAGNDISGKVYINKTQYFANVPELAWNFYIGGYQPAQKWLKDRKNRTLGFEEVSHYQKIIAILIETNKLMQELDKKA